MATLQAAFKAGAEWQASTPTIDKGKDLVAFGNYLLKKHNVESDGVTNEDLFNWDHPLIKND